MQIDFQRVSFPQDLRIFAREVVDGVPVTSIPKGWEGILIFHPATGQYYSTKSENPLKYEEIVRLRLEPRWSDIAVALQKMLNHHRDFQFFILPVQARPEIERWLASQGHRRISTMMGEGAAEPRALFKVYSPINKVTRYVVALPSSSRVKIIAQANAAMGTWLASPIRRNQSERKNMLIALRSRNAINTKIFEKGSEITRTDLLVGKRDNEYRTICMDMNLQAIREFIRSTVTG